MDIEYVNSIKVEDYEYLRDSAGWVKLGRGQSEAGLKNSSYIVSAYEGERCIGISRVIWDGGYVAYLADVIVLPEYQGMGIGRSMVRKCEAYVKQLLKPGWKIQIIGIAAFGKDDFYRKLGYRIRPNEISGSGFNQWFEMEEE